MRKPKYGVSCERGESCILFDILLIVVGGLDTYFNWKPLTSYFEGRARKSARLRPESSCLDRTMTATAEEHGAETIEAMQVLLIEEYKPIENQEP